MSILEKYSNPVNDEIAQERLAEREWKWVLFKFKVTDALDDSKDVRSIASNWGRWIKGACPSMFCLRDLPSVVDEFRAYTDGKKKLFLEDDLRRFVAWKFWEAKAKHGNICCSEYTLAAFEWFAVAAYETKTYTALSRIEKRRADAVIKELADQIGITPDDLDKERKKRIKEILSIDREPYFDVVREAIKNSLDNHFVGERRSLPGDEIEKIEGDNN